jgi:hypothetical protein
MWDASRSLLSSAHKHLGLDAPERTGLGYSA